MRRIALWMVAGTTVAWGVTTALVACSSSDTSTATDAGRTGFTSSSTSGNVSDNGSTSSSTSSTSSTSSSGSTKVDAGSDAGSSGASDPLKISCAKTECTTDGAGNGRCCWPGADAGAAVCAPDDGMGNFSCDSINNGSDYEFGCDEKADCDTTKGAGGALCCFAGGQAGCADDCAQWATGTNADNGDSDVGDQLCKTDAECGTGVTCGLKSCSFGTADNADQFTIAIRVCGTPTNCK